MASAAEQKLSRSLRAILAGLPNGANISDTEEFREALTGLSYFLPIVLEEMYREWKWRGLDGILPVVARKTGERRTEISGLCCFVCDQTWTLLHLHLQIAESDDQISWLECRLGERGPWGMVHTSYYSLNATRKRLYALDGKIDLIDWVYRVTFGHCRP